MEKPFMFHGDNCMKKVISVCLVLLLGVLTFTSCGSTKDEENATSIVASYSIKNYYNENEDFIVEVQKLGGVYEKLYDTDGIYIKFVNGEKIVDVDGNPVAREDLPTGATLQIFYDGTLAKNNPKTIKAYKIIVLD